MGSVLVDGLAHHRADRGPCSGAHRPAYDSPGYGSGRRPLFHIVATGRQ